MERLWLLVVDEEDTAKELARFRAYGFPALVYFVVLIFITGVPILIFQETRKAIINWNDDRIIRAMERDKIATERRMNRIAAREQ